MTLDLLARRRPQAAATGGTDNRGSHFPGFDGLRAIAALTVVGVHAAFVSGFTSDHNSLGRYTSRLEIGVAVFFVISGFLLYRPFVNAHFSGQSSPPAVKFWYRRLKRIIPAYWLAFVIGIYVLRADSGGHGWQGPLIYLGFAQIYFPHYILHGLSQAWSLCVEMTFYLMIPFYAALLARRRRSPARQMRVELAGVVALTAISFAYRLPLLPIAYREGLHHQTGGMAQVMVNWLPGYLDQFALGMFLAVVSAYLTQVGRRPTWLWHPAVPWVSWSVAVAAFVVVSNIGLSPIPLVASPTGQSLAREALYGLFGLALVVPAVFGPQERSAVRRTLNWRPLALVGVVSYGVYLWHETWIHMYLTWTGDRLFHISWWHLTVLALVLSLVAAGLSYLLVERPVLRAGRRRPAVAKVNGSGVETPGLAVRADAASLFARLIGARS
jgi:peptidoglycan/LPS O-acetylase OafA/YrhL